MCQKADRQGGLVATEALADARASDTLFNRSVDSQPTHAPVRKNIESHV